MTHRDIKPENVLVLDLETTSADPKKARIVQFALTTLSGEHVLEGRVNPGEPIPAAASAIHGITNADVADCRPFSAPAPMIQAAIEGKVLAGYNSRRFDVPVLDRELRAAGQEGIDLDTVVEIDALRVWTELRPRTLEGAVGEWLGHGHAAEFHADAHDALADCAATAKVIKAMLHVVRVKALDDAGDSSESDCLAKLVALSRPAYEIDRDGGYKLVDGRVTFANGKKKGEPVVDHLHIVRYRCQKDDREPDTDKVKALAAELKVDADEVLARIEASRPPWHVDDAGCFKHDDAGKVIYAKGKFKDQHVCVSDPSYLGWIIDKSSWPDETKEHSRRFLDLINSQPEGACS